MAITVGEFAARMGGLADGQLLDAIDPVYAAAFERVASMARSATPVQTGTLLRSVVAVTTRSPGMRSYLLGATARYAPFVEARRPLLRPAFLRLAEELRDAATQAGVRLLRGEAA